MQTPTKLPAHLILELEKVYDAMLAAEHQSAGVIEQTCLANRGSATNLVDYLALRTMDIEPLQILLHSIGLSSLTNSESHIKCQVVNILKMLGSTGKTHSFLTAEKGLQQMLHNVTELLGEPGPGSSVPIMVTFDVGFTGDVDTVAGMLENGMSIARINCAHDDRATWEKMIDCLNQAKARTELTCKLYMDLAGPKLRTQVVTPRHHHGKMKVAIGDKFILTDLDRKQVREKKYIRCLLPGVIAQTRAGERVFFDDGLFEGRIESIEGNSAIICVTHISAKTPVIKSEKGINFPDSKIRIDALTDFDLECLPFIATHADMVGFSFVGTADDIHKLQEKLKWLGKPDLPIIAKIETARAVDHLAEIILQGMHQQLTGVMVARGDLAIEIGFERMSEIQDELLWICEAAHVPVIWATQVLENLHKLGIATRGEITDAAHAARADAVMVNKGAHTLEVLRTLNNILNRSRKNNYKNSRLFRRLSVADKFFSQH